MLFYERAVPLNRERHHKLHMEPLANHYAFAARTNALLLASTELAEASRDYPIAFAGQEGGPFTLVALVGLHESQNLLVDESGSWEPNAYVPAVARRYPFVLAQSEDTPLLTVCIDEAYGGLNEARGERLFDEDGSESPYLRQMVEFLNAFHADMQRTQEFAARLHRLGLLTPKVITIKAGTAGSTADQTVDGVWIVDEERLRNMDDERVVELFRNGYMGWIYAHLLSLRNIERLAVRLQRASSSAPVDAPKKKSAKPKVGARASGWNGSERRKKPR